VSVSVREANASSVEMQRKIDDLQAAEEKLNASRAPEQAIAEFAATLFRTIVQLTSVD